MIDRMRLHKGEYVGNSELLNQLKLDREQRAGSDDGKGRWPWIIGGPLIAAISFASGAWWWSSTLPVIPTATAGMPTDQKAAAPTRGSPPVASRVDGSVLQATGYIIARRQATVSAQITGTLTEVLIEEGDQVVEDQVLARLEDSAYRANLDAALAAVEAARAQVDQMQTQLKQAESEAVRSDALVGRGLVSKQAAEQARTDVESIHSQVNAQHRNVAALEAQARVAKVNYDYTLVRAPFAGVVTSKAAQVGEVVSPLSGGGFTRTGVGTIVDMDSLEIDVDVNEAYIGRVRPGIAAMAVLDAYPEWTIPAAVIAIVPAVDRGKGTVKVRVALHEKDARIVPGMGVRVSFMRDDAKPEATSAPRPATTDMQTADARTPVTSS